MDSVLSSDDFELIDRIINTKRRTQKATQPQEITDRDRQQVILNALNVYERFCGLQNEIVNADAKVLIEYKQGLTKMTEEVEVDMSVFQDD